MSKTVVVRVDRLKKHPKYLKYYRISKKYKADDQKNEYHVGDQVIIQEVRPLSKEKRWKVAGLLKRKETDITEKAEEELENKNIEI